MEALKKTNSLMVCGVREYEFVPLDFVKRETFDQALQGVDRIFLNYPPETPFDVFHALIDRAKEKGVKHLVKHYRIYVPCGKVKTSFIDLRDIGEVAAITLLHPDEHANQKYVLTGNKALDFFEVADIMTGIIGRKIVYSNPSLKEFKSYMLQKGYEAKYVNLVAGLHTFTKLCMAKGIKRDFTEITGRIPRTVEEYVEDYKEV